MADVLTAPTRPIHAMEPQGWRNRYFAHGVTQQFFGASELIEPERIWPTRRIAEEMAAEFVAIVMADAPSIAKLEYLGAYPVYGPIDVRSEGDDHGDQ